MSTTPLLDQLLYRKFPKISAETPNKVPNRAAIQSKTTNHRGIFNGEHERSKDPEGSAAHTSEGSGAGAVEPK